jgi:hypothetical protein
MLVKADSDGFWLICVGRSGSRGSRYVDILWITGELLPYDVVWR